MELTDTRAEVRRVLLLTLALNLLVAVGKIAVGAASGVLAISADGVHSLIDGSSNLVALFANAVAARPPDEDHPYGHRRYETLAALLIGALLLLTAWEIVGGALERLQTGAQPDVTPLAFGVLVVTLGINLFVSRYERREGERLRSELLRADAANTSADVFVTLSVLISTALVALLGWTWADPLAALVIVALIVRAGLKVLRETGSVLIDRAPYRAADIRDVVEGLPNVGEVTRVRSRGPADAGQIDVDLRVPRDMTAEQTGAISGAIDEALRERLDGVAEVEVHFAPDPAPEADYALAARARADALGLATHEVRVTDAGHGKVLELHVEVPPGQTLREAHAQVSALEDRLKSSLPDVAQVVTHIEPALPAATQDQRDSEAAAVIRERAVALLRARFPRDHWHDVDVLRADGAFALTMHLTLPPSMPVDAAHAKAEAIELALRSDILELGRATIHTEPPEG